MKEGAAFAIVESIRLRTKDRKCMSKTGDTNMKKNVLTLAFIAVITLSVSAVASAKESASDLKEVSGSVTISTEKGVEWNVTVTEEEDLPEPPKVHEVRYEKAAPKPEPVPEPLPAPAKLEHHDPAPKAVPHTAKAERPSDKFPEECVPEGRKPRDKELR